MAEYSLPRVECRIYMNEAGKLYSETPITSAEGAIQLMAAELKDVDREMLCVLNLDNKSRPLNYHVVSIGTASASLAAIGNCLKTALLSGAVSIIAMHNHPSGIPEPSPEDRVVTEKLRNAARILEINFLDHLVVGKDGAWSIAHNHPVAYRDPGALFSEQETVYSAGEPQEGKYVRAFRLYEQTMQRMTASPENWMDFLGTASYMAMHPVEYQAMVYAQKPDATACATYSQWQRMGCVPRLGSHGICVPVFEMRRKGTGKKLEYLFDISDIAAKDGRRLPPLMEVTAEDLPYLESFLRREAGDFPSVSRESSLTESVRKMAGKAVSGAGISMAGTRDSLMETGLSLDDAGRQELENFLRDSLSYMLLHRINRPETGKRFSPEDFAFTGSLHGVRQTDSSCIIHPAGSVRTGFPCRKKICGERTSPGKREKPAGWTRQGKPQHVFFCQYKNHGCDQYDEWRCR